jgi:HYR domain/Bacterial surface protein, Ig-like domain
VSSSGTVNVNTPGTYTITYTASDSHNHTATATRSVIVESGANAPPTINLNGAPQMELECGTPFVDPGATAVVPCGGAVPVTVSGTVDVHTPGTYTITYTACVRDSGGQCIPSLTSEVERTVEVTPDATAPTIALNGANPMTVECHTTFVDPGAVAHDACAGDFAATASGTVNPNVVGQYTITYNATDPSGHVAAPVTRTVNVVDTIAPVVTPPANVTAYTGSGASACGVVVSDATLGTATASDACQGSLPVTRTGVPAGNVFPVGQTTVTYSAADASNNVGSATQTVTVIDNTAPVISCPVNIVVEPTCPSGAVVTYTTPVGTDNCAGATTTRTAGLASGAIFPIGTTTVTYTVTDASNNSASCSFTVTVLTPTQVIQNMINTINGLPLSGQQKQGLISKLTAALDAINNNQINVACNKLNDFNSQVQSFINNGTLTSAQGQPLINSSQHVRNTIGCTSLGCT